MKSLILVAVISLAACGTNDRDPGDIRTDNVPQNSGMDGRDVADHSGADVGNNVPVADGGGTSGPDSPADNNLPSGEICPYDDLQPFRGECDPVRLDGCPDAELCLTAIAVSGPSATVSSACMASDIHVLPEGAACVDTTERCAPGLLCIRFLDECRRLCYPDTSLGCESSEWCRRPSTTWEGIGFCDVDCNL